MCVLFTAVTCDSVCEKAEVALLYAGNMVCILHTLSTLLIMEDDVIHSHMILDDFGFCKETTYKCNQT